jgi:acyl dehydratase
METPVKFEVGESFSLPYTFSRQRVEAFAILSGDNNPIHIDPEFGKASRFGGNIVHGMFAGSLISCVLGNHFPGHGTIYLSQELHFLAPILVGGDVVVTCEIVELAKKNRAIIKTQVMDPISDVVFVDGTACVLLPRETK